MKIKNFLNKTSSFILKRLTELIGLILLSLSILLLISLVSYSPEDPNFIFPDNAEIKNLLGSKGSYTSDILYQSVGLISLLIPFTIFFLSLSVMFEKKILSIIESLFFVILYSITGALFFTVFHKETFWLTVNGNNGFIGNLFEETFVISFINLNHQISYIILTLIILLFFLLSIKFKLKLLKFFILIFTKSKPSPIKNFEERYDKNLISENDYVRDGTRVQENFSFEKNIKGINNLGWPTERIKIFSEKNSSLELFEFKNKNVNNFYLLKYKEFFNLLKKNKLLNFIKLKNYNFETIKKRNYNLIINSEQNNMLYIYRNDDKHV